MMFLLRKVRKALVDSSSLRKYMAYAFGEIFLVVIGILIALQINNWNENRKRRGQEIELLKSFRTELQAHSSRIDDIRSFNKDVGEAAGELRLILEERWPYEARFDTLFYQASGFTFGDQLSSASLDNLKSVGVDIISNQDLRKELILVFDSYSYIKEAQELYKSIILQAGTQLFSTRFDELWKGDTESFAPIGTMHPLDYESLFDDQEFLFFLKSIPNHLNWFVFKPCDFTQEKIRKVLDLLNGELESLQ